MFKLNKKYFYIIEAQGADSDKRDLLQARLKAKGIHCVVVGFSIEIHEVERNE